MYILAGMTESESSETFRENLDPTSALEMDISGLESKIDLLRRRKLTAQNIAGASLAIVGVVLEFTKLPFGEISERLRAMMGIAALSYGLILAFTDRYLKESRLYRYQSDLGELIARKRVLSRFSDTERASATGNSGESNYFDSLVKINVENLAAYYALVKVQTDKSFMVSVASGIIGFILIVMGLIFGFTGVTNSQSLAFVSSGAGVITEFISGVFFYLYNQTVRQMKGYHDSLLSVQNILLSFKLVGDTKDEKVKAAMVAQMLSYLIGGKSGNIPPLSAQPDGSITEPVSV
jgi:hypothetical protein